MSLDTKRRTDESLLEYEFRICDNRERYGLSWNQVAEILNEERGQYFGESKYRKWYVNFNEGIEFVRSKNMDSDEVLNELELKKLELLEERKKLQSVKVEYNKILREKARKELLFEQVRESFDKLEPPISHPKPVETKNKSYVLSLGDIHYGKEFESFHNKYNEQIAADRLYEILAETVTFCDEKGVNEIDVLNLGDSIEGMTLRVSQLKSLQSGFVDQVIKFSKLYARWINDLSKHVKVNLHHIVSSNHTEIRAHNTSRGEMPKEDMERIIHMYIHDVLEDNPNVNVHSHDSGIAEFELQGFNMIALHGHQVKNAKTMIAQLSNHRQKFYQYAFTGHLHHGNDLTVGSTGTANIKVIQSPSVMGSDEYSDSLLTSSMPGALITGFTEGKGKTETYEIVLN